MSVLAIAYFVGLVFHAYCAFSEIRWCDRIGMHINLFAHVRATVLLIFWPLVPLGILFDFYSAQLSFYARPSNPNR